MEGGPAAPHRAVLCSGPCQTCSHGRQGAAATSANAATTTRLLRAGSCCHPLSPGGQTRGRAFATFVLCSRCGKLSPRAPHTLYKGKLVLVGPVQQPPQCQEPSGKVGCKCMSFCKLSLSPSGRQRDGVSALATVYRVFHLLCDWHHILCPRASLRRGSGGSSDLSKVIRLSRV